MKSSDRIKESRKCTAYLERNSKNGKLFDELTEADLANAQALITQSVEDIKSKNNFKELDDEEIDTVIANSKFLTQKYFICLTFFSPHKKIEIVAFEKLLRI